jgi:hypothetical protein
MAVGAKVKALDGDFIGLAVYSETARLLKGAVER